MRGKPRTIPKAMLANYTALGVIMSNCFRYFLGLYTHFHPYLIQVFKILGPYKAIQFFTTMAYKGLTAIIPMPSRPSKATLFG